MACLVIAATKFELKAFAEAGGDVKHAVQLVTGIGPVETAVNLSAWLGNSNNAVSSVVNFGVAGAYPENGTSVTADLLDVCLARQEVLGDLGICEQDAFQRFSHASLPVNMTFSLDENLLHTASRSLQSAGIPIKTGTFVTVNCASGTKKRGCLLAHEFQGLCENMEGAAVARVCQHFAVPCIEVRCISNLVVNRRRAQWKLKQACALAGRAAATIVSDLIGLEQ